MVNAWGLVETVSGMWWGPPGSSAATSCQVSRAYRPEQDRHTLARRLLVCADELDRVGADAAKSLVRWPSHGLSCFPVDVDVFGVESAASAWRGQDCDGHQLVDDLAL